MSEDHFDKCIIGWSKKTKNEDVLENNGAVQVIVNRAQTVVPSTRPYDISKAEYEKFEGWFSKERNMAPRGVENMFYHNEGFIIYKTNESIGRTATASIITSLCFVFIVLLLSSRSIILAFFSAISVGFVMAAVICFLRLLNWSLGIYESICLAVVIGVGCDFVVHMSHAYCHHTGILSCNERTRDSISIMGPSIIYSFSTTFISACILLFCTHQFLYSFGIIFIFTMVSAVITTFVFFSNLTDLFGPPEPTKFIDDFFSFHCNKKNIADDAAKELDSLNQI